MIVSSPVLGTRQFDIAPKELRKFGISIFFRILSNSRKSHRS
jgi:hypothetical protein